MAGRGLRSVLEPSLYLGVAFLLHAMMFLIPYGGPKEAEPETTRGIRVKVVTGGSAVERTVPPEPNPPPANPRSTQARIGQPTSPGSGPGGPSVPSGGEPTPASGDAAGWGKAPPMTEYEQYLAGLRSERVQGWARETARTSKQEWKGAGIDGWGMGGGSGNGSGSGSGPGGAGPQGSGGKYLDPRVRMVVTSYPPTGIERRHTYVSYPDIQIKKHQYTSGWWNVYVQIRTDNSGNVVRYDVLRPETEGGLEKLFIGQVRKEVEKWNFDPVAAEIHVDVRFYVE